jgi:hypothetical protein
VTTALTVTRTRHPSSYVAFSLLASGLARLGRLACASPSRLRLARTMPPRTRRTRTELVGLSRVTLRSCRFVILLFLIVLSVFVVLLWAISFLTYIASRMYLYIDEPVGLVVLATPVTFRPYLLA